MLTVLGIAAIVTVETVVVALFIMVRFTKLLPDVTRFTAGITPRMRMNGESLTEAQRSHAAQFPDRFGASLRNTIANSNRILRVLADTGLKFLALLVTVEVAMRLAALSTEEIWATRTLVHLPIVLALLLWATPFAAIAWYMRQCKYLAAKEGRAPFWEDDEALRHTVEELTAKKE